LQPLIITTNLDIKEFKEKNDERLMSRIFEMCTGIKFTGNDYRLKETS
jgi:DNA replication protein DnaC